MKTFQPHFQPQKQRKKGAEASVKEEQDNDDATFKKLVSLLAEQEIRFWEQRRKQREACKNRDEIHTTLYTMDLGQYVELLITFQQDLDSDDAQRKHAAETAVTQLKSFVKDLVLPRSKGKTLGFNQALIDVHPLHLSQASAILSNATLQQHLLALIRLAHEGIDQPTVAAEKSPVVKSQTPTTIQEEYKVTVDLDGSGTRFSLEIQVNKHHFIETYGIFEQRQMVGYSPKSQKRNHSENI